MIATRAVKGLTCTADSVSACTAVQNTVDLLSLILARPQGNIKDDDNKGRTEGQKETASASGQAVLALLATLFWPA